MIFKKIFGKAEDFAETLAREAEAARLQSHDRAAAKRRPEEPDPNADPSPHARLAAFHPAVLEAVNNAVDRGDIIEAIKLYRNATGTDLVTAKNAIDTIVRRRRAGISGPEADAEWSTDGAVTERIENLLRQQKVIEAVKAYREAYGVGLKEAKDAIDAISARITH